MWDVRVTLSEQAFDSELKAVAFGVLERFDAVGRMGLIPRGITEVVISYDLDVPTGIFRIFAGDKLIVAIETPSDTLATAPISFHAKWWVNPSLEIDPVKPFWGCWYITAPEEQVA
jgi:hypothetical protein